MTKNLSEETRLHREERKKEKKRRKIKNRAWTVIKYLVAFMIPLCIYVAGFISMCPSEIDDFKRIETTVEELRISERKVWQRRGSDWRTDVVFHSYEGGCYYVYPYRIKEIMNTVEYFEELEASQRKVVLTVKNEDYLFFKGTNRFNGKWSIIDLQDGDKTIISINDYNESRRLTGIVLLVLATVVLFPIVLYSCVSFLLKKDNYKNRINKKIRKYKKKNT